jgi:hypothetical protein
VGTDHPCPFTPVILDHLGPILSRIGLPVHDPFAGTGERLGRLCDELGLPFTGTELEAPFIVDPRVKPGNSTRAETYPSGEFVVCTSPAYPNGMTDHFNAKDSSRRHTYRQALARILGHDQPLHEDNMGRWGNAYRRSKRSEARHFEIAKRCVEHWPDAAVVNVKDVVASNYTVHVIERWVDLLREAGYHRFGMIEVATPGQRHGQNSEYRADTETIIVARRTE